VNPLLAEIIDAHSGIDRRNSYERVEATIVGGGGFFPDTNVRIEHPAGDPGRSMGVPGSRFAGTHG
jgi:hypothetical protein